MILPKNFWKQKSEYMQNIFVQKSSDFLETFLPPAKKRGGGGK